MSHYDTNNMWECVVCEWRALHWRSQTGKAFKRGPWSGWMKVGLLGENWVLYSMCLVFCSHRCFFLLCLQLPHMPHISECLMKRSLKPTDLRDMTIGQLQVIVNDLHSQIESKCKILWKTGYEVLSIMGYHVSSGSSCVLARKGRESTLSFFLCFFTIKCWETLRLFQDSQRLRVLFIHLKSPASSTVPGI